MTFKMFGKDKYKRTLVVLLGMKSGRSLNKRLVAEGFAWRYRDGKHRAYKHAEDGAKRYRAGLWSAPNPVPPWKWRHGIR